MRIIDSHSHLNFSQFDDDREEALSRMRAQNIGTITVGTNLQTSQEAVMLAQKHEDMWASVGIHPTEPPTDWPESEFKKLIKEDVVVAIGECGLDYYRISSGETEVRSQQEEVFRKHINLAQETGLPLILHCRGVHAEQGRSAHDDVLSILKEYKGLRGVVHFFTGTLEHAKRYLEKGFYIGFDGPITFTTEYDNLIEEVPLERILVETDAPYAAPAPHRGKRNEPSYVVEIIRKIAEVKDVSFDEVAKQTTNNAVELFSLTL